MQDPKSQLYVKTVPLDSAKARRPREIAPCVIMVALLRQMVLVHVIPAAKGRTTRSKVPRVIRSVRNVHKGDTRQPRVSQTLLIVTRAPLERRTRTMAPRVAQRVSTVISTPKQRRQVRLNVQSVVSVKNQTRAVPSVPSVMLARLVLVMMVRAKRAR